MALTLSQLVSAVREEARDPSSVRWSDVTITRYLNDGQRELAQLSRKLNVWESSVAANTQSVAMPADMLFLREAAWQQINQKWGLDIRYGTPRVEPDEKGDPLYVYVVGGVLVLVPIPWTAGTLILAGTPKPVDMANATDTPSLEDCDSALIAYATYRCLLADGDPMAAARKQEWEELKNAWVIADAQRNPMPKVLRRREWWW